MDLWKRQAGRLNELRVAGKSHKMTEESKNLLQELTQFFSKKLPLEEELEAVERKSTELTRLDGRLSDARDRWQTANIHFSERKKQMKRNRSISGLVVCLILGAALLGGAAAFPSSGFGQRLFFAVPDYMHRNGSNRQRSWRVILFSKQGKRKKRTVRIAFAGAGS